MGGRDRLVDRGVEVGDRGVKVTVGIVTYNRPEYFEKCLKSVRRHLNGAVDGVYVFNDGSDAKYRGSYRRALSALDCHSMWAAENEGVAVAKNHLLERMLADGADWLFLLEDDLKVRDQLAVTGYLAACQRSGLEHLSFAHHGPGNQHGPVDVDGPVSYFQHAVGAWCLYSRGCLEDVGLFDEGFTNAWEHVEHTMRLVNAGYTTGPWRFSDATGSEQWLAEVPGSIERSAIRQRPDWHGNVERGRLHWKEAHPDTYSLIFSA